MMASYFPKALLYREWREGRWIYLAAALFTALPAVLALFGYLTIPQVSDTITPALHVQLVNNYWQSFYLDTEQIQNHYAAVIYFIATWVLVPALRIVPERRRGELDAMLVGPVDRAAWLRVKFFYGFAALLVSMMVEFVLLWIVHFQTPTGLLTMSGDPMHITSADLFREAGVHWVMYVSLFAMGFFISLCVSNTVGAPLTTLAIAMVPYWAVLVLSEIFPRSLVSHVHYAGQATGRYFMTTLQAPHGTWGYLLQFISPLTLNLDRTIGFTWRNPFLYWYLALAVIAYLGAMAYFRRLPAERFHDWLTRPSLWYWMLTGVSFIIGSFIGDMIANSISYRPGPVTQAEMDHRGMVFGVAMLIVSAALWVILYSVARARMALRERRASSRG